MLIKIEKQPIRALIDTGSQKTLIHESVYRSLKNKPFLKGSNINLQAANGEAMTSLGIIDLSFKIGGLRLSHDFIVVTNLNRNIILGSDFLMSNNARLYFDLKQIRLKDSYYFPFENDVFVSAITRTTKKVLLKPRTVYMVQARIKKFNYCKDKDNYELVPLERGFLADQPEIEICPAVVKLNRGRYFPVQMINHSSKHIRLKQGCVLGRIQKTEVINHITQQEPRPSVNEFLAQVQVSKDNFPAVKETLVKYQDCFAFSDLELEGTDLICADIDTGMANPINIRPYRTPLARQKVVGESIDAMLKAGIIRKTISPWSFPLIVVEKSADANGVRPPPRLVIDYRQLNKHIVIRSWPLPLIDDILAQLNGSTYFTSLDMRAGFHQIKLSESSIEKTAFSCFKGKYAYLRLPYGINNSPSIFQHMASKLLQGYESFTTAYIDDILIFTKSNLQDHQRKVELVMQRIRKHKLKLKLSKCYFAYSELKYLGFVINQQGIMPNEDKVKAIKHLLPPSNVKEVRSFLGTMSYYRKFIPNFAGCAVKLIALTKKYARFSWDKDCQNAFEYLKESLSVVPLLTYPDVNKDYILYTDASDCAVGSVLTQMHEEKINGEVSVEERPIYFLSHKMSDSQIKSYGTVEKECFAIYYALDKLHHYLHNAKFVIRTDHEPLKYLLHAPFKNRRIEKWVVFIQSFNAKVEYLKGTDNTVADLLSRSPDKNELTSESDIPELYNEYFQVDAINTNEIDPNEFVEVNISPNEELQPLDVETFDVIKEQEKDEVIVKLKRKLTNGSAEKQVYRRFMILNDILYFISQVDENPTLRLYVPSHLTENVLEQYHASNGHMMVDKIYRTLQQKYYFPNMFKRITETVEGCITCKKRSMLQHKAAFLKTAEFPFPFACISVDLSGPYRQTISGNNYIITFMDMYSGFPECYSLPDKKAETIVAIFLEEIIPRYGCPISILSDNGSEFKNSIFSSTLKKLNIIHKFTSVYAPWSNGSNERVHSTLNNILSKLINDKTDNWDLFLSSALLAIRTSVSKTTKQSPFYLLFNRLPLLPLDNLLMPRQKFVGEDFHEYVIENIHKTFLQTLKFTKQAKRESMKYDKNKNNKPQFDVGNHVFYKNHAKTNKLESNWITHFVIIKKTGPLSFHIRSQMTGKVVRVHANSLRHANVIWKMPSGAPNIRKSRLAEIPPSESDESSDSGDSEATEIYDPKEYRAKTDGDVIPNEGPNVLTLQRHLRKTDDVVSLSSELEEDEPDGRDPIISDSEIEEQTSHNDTLMDIDINHIPIKETITSSINSVTNKSNNEKIKLLFKAVSQFLD